MPRRHAEQHQHQLPLAMVEVKRQAESSREWVSTWLACWAEGEAE